MSPERYTPARVRKEFSPIYDVLRPEETVLDQYRHRVRVSEYVASLLLIVSGLVLAAVALGAVVLVGRATPW